MQKLFSIQPAPLEIADNGRTTTTVYFMMYQRDNPTDDPINRGMRLEVRTFEVNLSDIVYTLDEVLTQIFDRMKTFHVVEVAGQYELTFDKGNYVHRYTTGGDQFIVNRAMNQVARDTRRGVPSLSNGIFNGESMTYMYIGKHMVDRPVAIVEHNAKFAVVFHPEFDKYGFNVKVANNV